MSSEAIAHFRSVVADERWVQNSWQRTGKDGRHYFSLSAAWGQPGEIMDIRDYPTDLFPQWVFELMATLNDGIAPEDLPWLFRGFAERADGMAGLRPEAWEKIRTAFMIGTIRQALHEGAMLQPEPTPAYWQKVVDACHDVIDALEKGGDLETAAKTAGAAEPKVSWPARDAAKEAAWAAAAAARWAASEADAAEAAESAGRATKPAAAFRSLAELAFGLVDVEAAA